jgi:hypothetical protein
MFVRVARGSFPLDKADEILHLVETTLIPTLSQLPGFQRYHGGLDRESGRLVALSYWETAEQAQALQARRSPFEQLGVRFDTAETFEIVVVA